MDVFNGVKKMSRRREFAGLTSLQATHAFNTPSSVTHELTHSTL